MRCARCAFASFAWLCLGNQRQLGISGGAAKLAQSSLHGEDAADSGRARKVLELQAAPFPAG